MRGDMGLVRQLDRKIEQTREQLRTFEQTRKMLASVEPEVEGGETQVRRGPGRPKGSKNRANAGTRNSARKRAAAAKKSGRKRGPGRPKGSKNKKSETTTNGHGHGHTEPKSE